MGQSPARLEQDGLPNTQHSDTLSLAGNPKPGETPGYVKSPSTPSDAAILPPTQVGNDTPNNRWTLAINLAANGTFGGSNGADNQWKRLQELAEQTRGVPVSLVVQVVKEVPRVKGQNAKNTPDIVERYDVTNGQIRPISQGPSRGLAGDVTDLLHTASTEAPSDKIALIQQSHGGGTDGLEGAVGKATLPDFVSAVQDGLRGTNHDKLDLIDFDACSMASVSVLEKISKVANQMVASSETEGSATDGGYDAQNLKATIGALLANPDVSPAQLAHDMISQADRGANDGINGDTKTLGSGTPTLAQFDLTELPRFNASLNAFGNALATAAGDPSNLSDLIQSTSDSTVLPKQAIYEDGKPPESRDLSSFIQRVLDDAEAGKISDSTHQLRDAAHSMLVAKQLLEPNYHGSADGGYDKLGGLNTFLPGLDLLDTSLKAGATNPLPALIDQTDRSDDYASFEHRDSVLRSMQRTLTRFDSLNIPNHSDDLQSLRQSIQAVSSASNEQEMRQALDVLNGQARKLNGESFGSDVNAAARRSVQGAYFTRESIHEIPGWQKFVDMLRPSNP